EDGIRDKLVTGVQTCALPIYLPAPAIAGQRGDTRSAADNGALSQHGTSEPAGVAQRLHGPRTAVDPAALVDRTADEPTHAVTVEIGRASCRERVESSGGAGRV